MLSSWGNVRSPTTQDILPNVLFVLGFFFLGWLGGISSIETERITARMEEHQLEWKEDVPLSSLGPANIYTSGEKVKKLTGPPATTHSMGPVVHCPSVMFATLT